MAQKLDFEADAVAERNRDVAYDVETGGEGSKPSGPSLGRSPSAKRLAAAAGIALLVAAVVLWRHARTQYMSLPGLREEPAQEEPSEEASPEDLLAGAHSASLAMAISAAVPVDSLVVP